MPEYRLAIDLDVLGGGAPPPPRGSETPEGPGREGGARDEELLRDIVRRIGELEEGVRTPAEEAERRQARARALLARLERLAERLPESEALAAEVEEMRASLKSLEGDSRESRSTIEGLASTVEEHSGVLGHIRAIMSNPAAFVTRGLPGALGIMSGPVGIAAMVATLAATMLPELIRLLARKGWPLNRDFRRVMEDEANAAFDLRQQADRERGTSSFIVAQDTRFQPQDGSEVFNSLYMRDELRAKMVPLSSKVGGLY